MPGGSVRSFPPRGAFGRDDDYGVASPQLLASPLHRGHRAAIPRREALILQAALNHPWLLHDHLEELSETEFRHADTRKLKAELIDVLAHRSSHEPATTRKSSRRELAAELRPPWLCRPARPHRAVDYHALGLGRAPGGRASRRFADLETAYVPCIGNGIP